MCVFGNVWVCVGVDFVSVDVCMCWFCNGGCVYLCVFNVWMCVFVRVLMCRCQCDDFVMSGCVFVCIFYCVGLCTYGFCNVWLCVCVHLVKYVCMCGRVYV